MTHRRPRPVLTDFFAELPKPNLPGRVTVVAGQGPGAECSCLLAVVVGGLL